jgi:hypothetical protein
MNNHYTDHVVIDLMAYWAAQSDDERAAAIKPFKPVPKKRVVWNGPNEDKVRQILDLHPNTLRNAAEIARVNQDTVKRIWKEAGLTPTPGTRGRPTGS